MWVVLLVMSGAFLGVLFVPADVSLEMNRNQTFNVVLGFRWLFIRVRRELPPTRAKEKAREKSPERRSTPIPTRTFAAVLKVPGIWAGARRFATCVASSIRVLEVGGRIRLGTGDPADTGRLWALVGPLMLWCNQSSRVDVRVEPDFSRACLAGTLGGTVRLHPARLAYGIGSTVFSMMTIRLVVALLRSRPWRH